jgi:putative ABC transport system substrate-binding protein
MMGYARGSTHPTLLMFEGCGMRRREVITLVGGTAAAWPVAARAQPQRTLPVIAFLGSTTAAALSDRMPYFWQGLKEIGFSEGQNVGIEFRWANDDYDRLPELAADLVRRRPALIVTSSVNLAVRAAMRATATIPIVFMMGADPVQLSSPASTDQVGM